MKEIKQFPNIKAIKLKEEINKDNLKNNFKTKKIKISKYKGIKYCLLYIFLFSSIITFFAFNFIKTKDVFEDNKYIILSAEKLCSNVIKIFAKCYKEKEKVLAKCINENKAVEHCYDEAYKMNQICYVYISELELCLRKNKNQNQKCENNFYDVIKCGANYRHLNIERDYLKEIANYNL